MKRTHRALALVTGLVLALLAFSPAQASTGLEITDVAVDEDVRSMSLVLSGTDLPPDTGLDPASVQVVVDGRRLPPTSVVSAAEAPQDLPPIVLLVVDTSGSMAGQPMIDAKTAISAFVAQAPADVGFGLLAFSTTPRLLVPPTLDRPRLLGAVATLEAQGETALYDAVAAGVAALGTDRDRRLIVLSDGGDTRSTSTLQQALAAITGSGIAMDAIGFHTDESVQDVLAQLSTSGGGQVHAAASSAELADALASAVREHPTALAVRVLVPDDLRGAKTMSVSVATPGGRLSATKGIVLGDVPPPQVVDHSSWGGKNALLAGLAAIAVSLVLGTLALVSGRERDRVRTRAVLDQFSTVPTADKRDLRSASVVTRTALELADKVVTKRNLHDQSELRLARAALSMTPAEWILLQAGTAFGIAFLLVVLGGNLLLAGVVGIALGVLGPAAFLRVRGRRRQKAFADSLPDALQLTAGSLSAGYSLAQALDGIVREGSEPMATEIGRALAESRLGIPVETTLEAVADRMESRDFAWVVMAIRVQREVGGNLAGILTTVAGTMRERAMLRRHVRGLSAEGRLSAYILVGLPVFLALYMLTLRREYIEPLYTTGLGTALIVVALLLLSTGSFVMSRMVKVEV